jgi:hypothetical protein
MTMAGPGEQTTGFEEEVHGALIEEEIEEEEPVEEEDEEEDE